MLPENNSPVQREKITCPVCGETNALTSEYCWKCYCDFEPNTTPSRRNHPERKKPSGVLLHFILFFLLLSLSLGIVYGSWWLYKYYWGYRSLKVFLVGWLILLGVAQTIELMSPDPNSNLADFWAPNPFKLLRPHRFLSWTLFLILPGIILTTLKMPFGFCFGKALENKPMCRENKG